MCAPERDQLSARPGRPQLALRRWAVIASLVLPVALGPAPAIAARGTEPLPGGRFELRGALHLVKRGAMTWDLENMLADAGLGDDVDFRPYSFQPYPTSPTGDLGSVGVALSWRVAPRLAVSVEWSREELVRALGHRAATSSPTYFGDMSGDYFLEATTKVGTASGQLVWRGRLMRLEAGPALHFIEQRDLSGRGAPKLDRSTRLGLIVGAGLSVPPESPVFLDFAAQYRVLGSVRRGPIPVTSASGTLVVPERSLRLDHGVVTIGLGVRW